MAIKRKSKNKGYGKRAINLLLTTVGVFGTNKLIDALDKNGAFKQSKEASDANKKNWKPAIIDGGIALAAGTGAVLIKNDYVSALLAGASAAATDYTIYEIGNTVKGMNGLGSTDPFRLYEDMVKPRTSMNGVADDLFKSAQQGRNNSQPAPAFNIT